MAKCTSMFNSTERPTKAINIDKSLAHIAPRVIALARMQTKTLLIGLISLALGTGITLFLPRLIENILNEKSGLSISNNLTSVTSMLIALFAIQATCFYVRHYCFQAAGLRIVSELRKSLFSSILNQDISFFDNSKVGDLLSRLSSDAQLVQRAVTTNISVALRYVIQVIGGTALMLLISPKLTAIIILLIPVLVGASIMWGKKLRTHSRRMQAELGKASTIAEERFSAIRTVKMFMGQDAETTRYGKSIDIALQSGLERTKVASLFTSSMVFLLHSSVAFALCYGVRLVFLKELTIGELTSFLLYCGIVAISFAFLAGAWDEFMQAVGASERIFEIIDLKPTITAPSNPISIPTKASQDVTFECVSFSYPSRAETKVLDDISFDIREGQSVAIVGPSGSGKSTIASLIQRFYDPQKGTITYSGIDLTKIDPANLRRHMSVVPQTPHVFSVSIGENISYGNPTASLAEVIASAKTANLHDFVTSLPNSYDTLVGDKGIQLSGGERQRIAIARAIIKDPRFLILDEATSSLDSENEKLIQQALERLMQGRTTLVIAHRLSTVQHADKVIVLKQGKIVQTGTHETLLAREGLYKTLVEHQLL